MGNRLGCIPPALLAERPDLSAVAVDANPRALGLSWRNLKKYGLLSRCLLWHSRNPEDIPVRDEELDLVVSNPPYIPSSRLSSLPGEVRKEPLPPSTEERTVSAGTGSFSAGLRRSSGTEGGSSSR